MSGLDLAQPRLAAHALDRGDRLGRAEANGLVEDDPAVHPPPLGPRGACCQYAFALSPLSAAISFALSRCEGGGAEFTNDISGQRSPRTIIVAKRRSEEHTSELQSLMRNSYAVFC